MRSLAWVSLLAVTSGCGDAGAAVPIDAAASVDGGVADDSGHDSGTLDCPPPLGMPAPWTPATVSLPMDGVLRVDQLQSEGTHNSYHVQPRTAPAEWQYTHAPLDVQLESQGVRAVELDVWWTPRCGRYRVYHAPVVDAVSTCDWLSDCLQVVRTWSDAHPGHQPLFIQLEIKQLFDAATASDQLAALDAELSAVFPREALLTPADLQGSHASVREGLDTDGWPTLGATRGRVLFFLDNRGDGFGMAYTHGGADLLGRTAFAPGAPSDAFAAIAILNDPVSDHDAIVAALSAHMVVRTRADTDGVEARANDRTRLEAALASGAHIVSTDFPAPVAGLDYSVEIPGGMPSRCNPVTAPAGCGPTAIEDPARLVP